MPQGSKRIATRGTAIGPAAENRPGSVPKIFVSPPPVTISQAIKVTKWSTFTGDIDVSEQKAEQTSGESGSLNAGAAAPSSSEAMTPPVTASAEVESPKLAPEQSEAGPSIEVTKEAAKEAAKEALKETSKADAPRAPGRIMIMSSGDRTWDAGARAQPEPEPASNQDMLGKRRLSALAAVVALATVAGALGGALATAGLGHFLGGDTAGGNHALETSVARIDADIQALKVGVDHTAKIGISQFNKTSERLDKIEKAQAEPAAKLAKLSETVDKLRAAPAPVPVAAAASAAAKEVTGSISPPAATAAATPSKNEVGRLPTVEGWLLRDIGHGGALIEGRRGIYEVYAGDEVPGLGRVDAVRRQDGRWVVVTTKGLIVAR
jgi:hypothetical protein